MATLKQLSDMLTKVIRKKNPILKGKCTVEYHAERDTEYVFIVKKVGVGRAVIHFYSDVRGPHFKALITHAVQAATEFVTQKTHAESIAHRRTPLN